MTRPLSLRECVMHYALYKRAVAAHQELIEIYEEYYRITPLEPIKLSLAMIVESQKSMQKEMLKMQKQMVHAIETVSKAWDQLNGNYGETDEHKH